ncbi:MAG: hypothetical protein CSB16_01785 [Clostridiales bacterium]|nr:MAG: hypothetical protein CSB16_01785 [Clostridiales bacterium]
MNQKKTDEMMNIVGNKYILSKLISSRARQVKHEEKLTIGYMAINAASEELLEGKLVYTEDEK